MKAEKGSEIIATICEYENSVAMPDNERLTYLDTCGIARLKDGNGNASAQEAHANRCSEYLRFGHEVDLAACGAYSPYDALKVCDTPSRDRCLRHSTHRGHQAGRHGKLRRARSGDEYGLKRLQQAKLHPLLRPVTGYGCLRVRKRKENRSARRPIRSSACGKLLRSRY